MYKNRLGKIQVAENCVENFWRIIDDFIPINITINNEYYKVITYTGTHPKFKTLKNGDLIPGYTI